MAMYLVTLGSFGLTAEKAAFVPGSLGSMTGMGSWASKSRMESYFNKHGLPPCEVSGVLIYEKGTLACEEILVNDIILRIDGQKIDDKDDWEMAKQAIEAEKTIAVAVKRLNRSVKKPKWETVQLEIVARKASDVQAAEDEIEVKNKAIAEGKVLALKQEREELKKRHAQWEKEGAFSDSNCRVYWKGDCVAHGTRMHEWDCVCWAAGNPAFPQEICGEKNCKLRLIWRQTRKQWDRKWPDGTITKKTDWLP